MAAQVVAARALVACVAEAESPVIPRQARFSHSVSAVPASGFMLPALTVRIGTDRALQ